jgi:hypothetical protein
VEWEYSDRLLSEALDTSSLLTDSNPIPQVTARSILLLQMQVPW